MTEKITVGPRISDRVAEHLDLHYPTRNAGAERLLADAPTLYRVGLEELGTLPMAVQDDLVAALGPESGVGLAGVVTLRSALTAARECAADRSHIDYLLEATSHLSPLGQR